MLVPRRCDNIFCPINLITLKVKLSPSFASGNFRSGFKDILFSGSTDVIFDLQAIGGSGSTVIEIQTTHINNKFTFKARTTADFVEARMCQILGKYNTFKIDLR